MKQRKVLAVLQGLILAAVVGCSVTTVPGQGPAVKPRGSVRAVASPTSGLLATPLPTNEPPRVIPQLGEASSLIGKVKLISDLGGAIISNNSAGVISDHGSGIISDHGGGVVSDHGGGVISSNGARLRDGSREVIGARFGLLADVAVPEALLADAAVEILDAAGHRLVDDAGKPLGATTDASGNYRLQGVLPEENLVLRIRLFPNRPGAQGQLLALLVYDPNAEVGAAREISLDTASSLGASYVLAKYVNQRREVLDRLARVEAEALQRDTEAARALLPPGIPTYQGEDLVAAMQILREKAAGLNQTLERIEAILLAGQKNLGEGLGATAVALGGPHPLLGIENGTLLIGESRGGRLRRVELGVAGTPIHLVAGDGSGRGNGDGGTALGASFGSLDALVRGPDGSIYIADGSNRRVRRIGPDGTITTVAGNGGLRQDPLGGAAITTSIERPGSLLFTSEGELLIGEAPEHPSVVGRLLRLKSDGRLVEEAFLPSVVATVGSVFNGLAATSDGTQYALDRRGRRLVVRRPGQEWAELVGDLKLGNHAGLAAVPQGGVYVSEDDRHRVIHVDPDGTVLRISGTRDRGFSGDGGPAADAKMASPSGLWVGPDGTLYVSDEGNNVVRAIAPDGDRSIRTVAGTMSLGQTGDALTIPINGPVGLALDATGRLVVSETFNSTIKRLEGQVLTTIAGSSEGYGGDGGLATTALFSGPVGIAFHEGGLFVVDAGNDRIRRIGPDGMVTSVVARDTKGAKPGSGRHPALSTPMVLASSLGFGLDGILYWVDTSANQIWRLTVGGESELLAGSGLGEVGDKGDGGPALSATFDHPIGLAVDVRRGAGVPPRLFISDTGNLRIRVIDLATTPPTISTVAGMAKGPSITRLIDDKGLATDGAMATDTALFAPTGLAIDEAGNLFVGEFGSARLEGLGGKVQVPVGLLPKIPSRIRKITPDGKIYGVAGVGTRLLPDVSGDNSLQQPTSLLFDRQGRLIIADNGNNQLKLLPKGSF